MKPPLNMTILSSKTTFKNLFSVSIHINSHSTKILYFLSFIFLKKEEKTLTVSAMMCGGRCRLT